MMTCLRLLCQWIGPVLSQFGYQVAYGGHGMNENHSGAYVAHNLSDLLLFVGSIAVDVAFAAARLPLSLGAVLQTLIGISQQALTLAAKTRGMMMLVAVDFYHLPYHLLFSVDSIHGHIH